MFNYLSVRWMSWSCFIKHNTTISQILINTTVIYKGVLIGYYIQSCSLLIMKYGITMIVYINHYHTARSVYIILWDSSTLINYALCTYSDIASNESYNADSDTLVDSSKVQALCCHLLFHTQLSRQSRWSVVNTRCRNALSFSSYLSSMLKFYLINLSVIIHGTLSTVTQIQDWVISYILFFIVWLMKSLLNYEFLNLQLKELI